MSQHMYALLLALMGSVSAPAGPPVETYIDEYLSPSISTSTATFSGIIVPSGGLLIVRASIRASAGRTITGITVDGNAMDVAVASASNQNATAIFYRTVSAATVEIIVTASGAIALSSIDVSVVSGLASTTPIDTDTVASSTGTGSNRTLTLTDDAIGFWTDSHGSTDATTWTGSGLVVDHDSTAGASHRHSSVTYQASTGENKNAASSWLSSVPRSICAAAWR